MAPKSYERQLLARYQVGELTIDEVLTQLEASTYHVSYHSRVTDSLTPVDLQALVEQACSYNAQHELTGLLL